MFSPHLLLFSRNLLVQNSFIDGSKVALYGVHYGGFLAALLLSKSSFLNIKCAVSSSPVVDLSNFGKFGLALGMTCQIF